MSDVDQAIADGRVPPDVTRAILLESKDRAAVVGISIVTILTFLVVCGRVVSRTFIVRRFGYDDGLAVVSLALLIAYVGLCIELICLGSGRHFAYIQYVLPVDIVMRTQILDFVAHIIYTVALLVCRISGLAFYYRICSVHHGFLIAIQAVFAVIVAGFMPQLFLLIFHCRPVTGLWPYGWEPGWERYTCLQWGLVYSVNSSVSLVCDFLLFGIPVAMLKILEMPRKRKLQLACILLPGLGVVGISITRLVLVIKGQWEADMSWSYNPMLAVETSEIGATLIALSIPGIKPIFDKYVLNTTVYTESGNSKYNRSATSKRSRGTALSTFRLRSQHSMLSSQENTAAYGNEVHAISQHDGHSQTEADGIFVRVDFDVKEGQLETGHPGHPGQQSDGKYVQY
ncbi:hypothetical protein X797_000198 [Metarhizium robertsii]|uniref:Rhodopsin domain-containing protein n=3 Tax=Metarhizium TaxID=5529 RepID=A0A0D9PA22_METAN|nr:proteinrelated to integral membrane protein pth11 [Metarhizium robertsii ARSEF 23]EFZ02302.2 proteinrelated to integral membrane protein pth11 [Metarhizium robertsii ARSEF 23]EXV05483.1 hypothetical protein X797_000198 [Metarhizium robertsii]KJK81645.1 hypothetical protein H634G_02906 [Metarhizium anisopliae BRIP 53293]KJK87101.1 hypothetical protein H633G_09065 [Metarhizium anisopliae BRIP 53284]